MSASMNQVKLTGYVQRPARQSINRGVVALLLRTPDRRAADTNDYHRVECADRLATEARKLLREEMVFVEGSLHYRGNSAYILATRIESEDAE